MNVVAAILALVALVLVLMLLVCRRTARSERTMAAGAQAALDAKLTAADAERARHEQRATEADQRATDATERATAEVAAATESLRSATARAEVAEATFAEQSARIESLERYAADLAGSVAAADERRAAAVAELATERDARAAAEAVAAAAAAAAAATPAAATSGTLGGIDPELLWALEITRSERTWRHSVALDPSSPSPFPEAADQLKLAVEVEAAAIREDVGAFINLRWDAEPIDDAIRRLLVLRIANELLAAASREPQPFEMHASGTRPLVIRLHSSEEGDRQLHLDPPQFGTEVIDFAADANGVTVTIA